MEEEWEGRKKKERWKMEGENDVLLCDTQQQPHYTFGYRMQRAKPLTILTTTSHDKWMFEFWHHLSVNFLQSGTLKMKIKKKLILREVC